MKMAATLNLSFTNDLDMDKEPKMVLHALNQFRLSLQPPYQSHFRVICLVVYEDGKSNVRYELGVNAEPCVISGSICAERAALIQLRLVTDLPVKLLRVYCVTDDAKPLFPGMLCREYLTSLGQDDLPIIVADCATADIQFSSLGELYPYPSLFRHVDRDDLLNTAEAIIKSNRLELPDDELGVRGEVDLYHAVLEATARDDKDDFHPIRYAAGVLFDDGSMSVSWQKKGNEYGTTIDAIVQLAHVMETEKKAGGQEKDAGAAKQAVLLLQVDQFGICHAPFGAARAFLKEYGYFNVKILVHNLPATRQLKRVTIMDLSPSGPVIEFERKN